MAPDQSIWDQNYVNEEHMRAFQAALDVAEDDVDDSEAPNSPVVPNHPGDPGRPLRVRALPDWSPINTRVSTRRVEDSPGFWFRIFRWPLLGSIFALIFWEFMAYVFIRQCVNTYEWVFVNRNYLPLFLRGRKAILRAKLRNATTFDEYKATAKELDQFLGFNAWKQYDEDPFYDYVLVRKGLKSLRRLRRADDAEGIRDALELCVRANFAGIESQRLYSQTFYKTKELIEAYTAEVEQALAYIRETPRLSVEEKRKFYRSINTNLGVSALCLSGGASFGYYHFGVVRALLDANMLPRVISGTSAGGLVAAMVGTHTDEELRELLVPKLADYITACYEPAPAWMRRAWRTGARFDTVDWARRATFFTRGSLTFREAYELTGRVLNISVIPGSRFSPSKLLNYLSAPDCVIWSAIIASAAVPGILNPVVLMEKTKTGELVPWSWGSRFKDGSLRVDIPLQSLNTLFNVNYPIVSQVNPHVHLFNFSPRGAPGKPVARRTGKGWRGGFLLAAWEEYLKQDLIKNLKVIRGLDLMPIMWGQDWSGVFLQRFEGVVTITPRSRALDWLYLLSDPDQTELARMIQVGQIVTWPKMHMIENRYRIEKEIYRGRMAVRLALRARDRGRAEVKAEVEGKPGAESVAQDTGLLEAPAVGQSAANGGRSVSPDDRTPWPSATRQTPLESEGESNDRNRILRRLGRRHHANGDHPSEPRAMHSSNGHSRSGLSRLRHGWSRDPNDGDDEVNGVLDQRSDANENDPPPYSRPSGSRSHQAADGSSAHGSLGRRSFPLLSSLVHSLSLSGRTQEESAPEETNENGSPATPEISVEQWSSDSDDDEDLGFEWPGVMHTPNVGSPLVMRRQSSYFESQLIGNPEGEDI